MPLAEVEHPEVLWDAKPGTPNTITALGQQSGYSLTLSTSSYYCPPLACIAGADKIVINTSYNSRVGPTLHYGSRVEVM